jgi:DNA-binding IclR family transcriptional regulator
VSDEELLTVIRRSDGPAVTARAVAEELPLSRRCAHARLSELAEEGQVETKSLSDRSRIWWLTE